MSLGGMAGVTDTMTTSSPMAVATGAVSGSCTLARICRTSS
jgi:hypothetical protein